ncbi:MAG: ABC transporter permease [Actinomycetes bacterium]|nr:ABC transporter permease [Actinomycetes bacterium]
MADVTDMTDMTDVPDVAASTDRIRRGSTSPTGSVQPSPVTPTKRRVKPGKRIYRFSSVVYLCLIYLFLFLPIIVIVVNSFNANRVKPYIRWTGFTLDWYAKAFQSASLIQSFENTLIIAVVSTVLAVLIGTLAAVGMYRYKFRGKGVVDALLYIPVVIPEIVLGIALLSMFTRVNIPRGMLSLIIAHVTFCIPFVVFNVRARLAQYDDSIEEASMDLGANRVVTFMRITLPMLLPGIAGGALLAFTLSIDDVIVSYFTNGQVKTFPLKVMESIKSGVSPAINALSTIILVGTIVIVVLSQSGILSRRRVHSSSR